MAPVFSTVRLLAKVSCVAPCLLCKDLVLRLCLERCHVPPTVQARNLEHDGPPTASAVHKENQHASSYYIHAPTSWGLLCCVALSAPTSTGTCQGSPNCAESQRQPTDARVSGPFCDSEVYVLRKPKRWNLQVLVPCKMCVVDSSSSNFGNQFQLEICFHSKFQL